MSLFPCCFQDFPDAQGEPIQRRISTRMLDVYVSMSLSTQNTKQCDGGCALLSLSLSLSLFLTCMVSPMRARRAVACRVRMRARQEGIKIVETSHAAKDASTGMQQTDMEGIQMLLRHFRLFKTCEALAWSQDVFSSPRVLQNVLRGASNKDAEMILRRVATWANRRNFTGETHQKTRESTVSSCDLKTFAV